MVVLGLVEYAWMCKSVTGNAGFKDYHDHYCIDHLVQLHLTLAVVAGESPARADESKPV